MTADHAAIQADAGEEGATAGIGQQRLQERQRRWTDAPVGSSGFVERLVGGQVGGVR
jgi:hypothetical protein